VILTSHKVKPVWDQYGPNLISHGVSYKCGTSVLDSGEMCPVHKCEQKDLAFSAFILCKECHLGH
jgi:hypothetical protein